MKINLNPDEIEVLLDLSLNVTGIQAESNEIRNYVIENVKQRMFLTQKYEFKNYLLLIDKNIDEYEKFLSAITVHTTGWFRELDHFNILSNEIKNLYHKLKIKFIRILSIPCSTGEEVYSIAFLLQNLCNELEGLKYEIYGLDIDKNSIQKCRNAVYLKSNIANIPDMYQKYIRLGSGEAIKYFAICKEVREHCFFFESDIRSDSFLKDDNLIKDSLNKNFDIIFCRNLFIYFDQENIHNSVNKFRSILNENGLIYLGHSESIDAEKNQLIHIGNSIYKKKSLNSSSCIENDCVEIIGYSTLDLSKIKPFYEKMKKEFKSFQIINTISSLKEFLGNKKVKLLVVDRDSKSHDLIQYLYNLLKIDKNIFVIESILYQSNSSIKHLDVFHESQIFKDFLDWRNFDENSSNIIIYLKRILTSLIHSTDEIRDQDTLTAKNRKIKKYLDTLNPSFIAIGASTGGTIALTELLKNIPKHLAPILIVQHLPHIFAKEFIDKIQKVSGLKFISARDRPELKPGHIYMADGDHHIAVKGNEGHLRVEPDMSPAKKELRPCVDILFESLAKTKAKGVAILLTGMGNDGAHGLLKLMQNGCLTITQSESSCVIYGMPKEAEILGASCYSGDLFEIRQVLNRLKGAK